MTTKNSSGKKLPQQDLIITRVFDAPRDLVWKAWTEPEAFKRWYGPKNFTCTVSKVDLRVGGKRLNNMRSPEGMVFWYTGIYKEVVPLQRLVFTDSLADENGNVVPAARSGMPQDWPAELLVTLTFEEHQGKTKMTLRFSGAPEGMMRDGAERGWKESFDKLAESLAGPKGRS